ncbi:MAG: hypothetical protein FWG92_07360 [Leptospirales bacterium]|nr:hypothetical protein [Leptospirales bacterium]
MSVFLKEYNVLAQNFVLICAYLFLFISLCGIIRFGIAIKRRRNGVYPPSSAQMEN